MNISNNNNNNNSANINPDGSGGIMRISETTYKYSYKMQREYSLRQHQNNYHKFKNPIMNEKFHYVWAILIIFISIILYYLTTLITYNLPQPLTTITSINDNNQNLTHNINNSEYFIEENAYKDLKQLVKIGPRVVGSTHNEQNAVKFLIDKVQKIQIEMKNKDKYEIEIDVQEASGNYIIWNMLNVYQGIQNVIVKLKSKTQLSSSPSAILLNSHFDTVPGSPGAGDDGLMVVTMLEVLRVIVNSDNEAPLKHSVIFLFNGAEENPLQGSHAFITQHKWAKDVKAFINLDAAGNSGKEVLFQSGPKNSWLLNYYKKSVVHPLGHTIAEELFQKRFIPSDTDFRIFRDFGKIPGLDLAYSFNGYVYHTKYDNIDSIAKGSLQHTGDNVLELTKALGNAIEIDNITMYDTGEQSVFFDVFGLFFISYDEMIGFIVNLSISIIAIILLLLIPIPLMKRNSIYSYGKLYTYFSIIFFYQLLSVTFGISLIVLLAFLFDCANFTMRWFTNVWLLFGLYLCPLFFVLSILPALYLNNKKSKILSLDNSIQLFLHSQCIIFAVTNIICTSCLDLRLSYIFTIAIFFYVLSVIFNSLFAILFKNKADRFWIIFHLIFQILPFMYFSYLSYLTIIPFVPMTGRAGGLNNPEYVICGIVAVFGLLGASFLPPLLCNFKKPKVISSLFALTFLIFLIIAITPVGFPYREKTSPQRHSIFHTKRIFYNSDLTKNKSDSGFFVSPMDRQLLNYVNDYLKNITIFPIDEKDCQELVVCGLPVYSSAVLKAVSTSFWSPTEFEPNFSTLPKLQLVSKLSVDKNITRFEFKLYGPDHMILFISPKKQIKLMKWSLNDNVTLVNNNNHYLRYPHFIRFSYGIDSNPYQFYLDFERPETYDLNNLTFDIAVIGHLTHNDRLQTDIFKNFLNLFPKWTYVTGFVSSYQSWQF